VSAVRQNESVTRVGHGRRVKAHHHHCRVHRHRLHRPWRSIEDMTHAREVTDDQVRAWHLAQVRAEQDRTQEEVAHVMGVRQPRVSAIERGELDVVTLATLRTYVRALGGSLWVVADFGDWEYRLT